MYYIMIGVLFFYTIVMLCGEKRSEKIWSKLFLFILWFLTSFRSEIAWDYDSYKILYYSTNIDSLYPEKGFLLINEILKYFDFDYQMMFVVFSTLMFYFLYKGFSYYKKTNKNYKIISSLLIFAIFPDLWLGSLSSIRQHLAIAIIFWGSRYIFERNFAKYFFIVVVATMFHYSAFLMIIIYFFNKELFPRLVLLSAPIGFFCLSQTTFINSLIMNAPLLDKYAFYIEESTSAVNTGASTVFLLMLYYLMLNIKCINSFYINVFLIGIFVTLLCSNFGPIMRMRSYFFIFICIVLQDIIRFYNIKYKMGYLLIVLIFAWNLSSIYARSDAARPAMDLSSESGYNMNYSFNFKLIR